MESKNLFMEALTKVIDEHNNVSITENGAVGYKTTNSKLLDLHFMVSSLRRKPDSEIYSLLEDAYEEDKENFIKWVFYVGDVREGLGERRLFKLGMEVICSHCAAKRTMFTKLLELVPEYTRWDNLLHFMTVDTHFENEVMDIIKNQLTEDMNNFNEGKPISLLAKWMPSVNTSSKETVSLAKTIANNLGLTPRQYRKALSNLRTKLNIVEQKMSANKWEDINYPSVPSKANLIYRNAFLKHDEERRREYISSVLNGTAKINSTVTFPHEIINKMKSNWYSNDVEERNTYQAMWKALPDIVKGNGNTICVCDTSGSMVCRISNSGTTTAFDVASALSIYFSERCSGPFENTFITFSTTPSIVKFDDRADIFAKYKYMKDNSIVANTNIAAVFALILETAKLNELDQSELPENILILSDMEFDSCATTEHNYNNNSWWSISSLVPPTPALFTTIANEYAKEGYKLPRLIFWNIASRTGTIPVKTNDLGVTLVSGFSVNTMNMVLSGELDPYKNLINQLNTDRYKPVIDIISNY